MPKIQIVDSFDKINLSNEWVESTKFRSKGRVVGNDGKPTSSNYHGNSYRIISKKEKSLSTGKRISRGCVGLSAVIFTLGIALLFKRVRNLFTNQKEKIRFAVPESGEYEKSIKELQNGVNISEDTISKIQSCMKNILSGKDTGGVKHYNCQGNHRVFSLDSAPEYIFKMKAYSNVTTFGRDDSMRARFEKMVAAQTVCRVNQLGLLVIPNAKLFSLEAGGKKYEIIAEKKLDFNPDKSKQEELFAEYGKSLNDAIRQLAIFICKTGYSDVEWRNNPVLNNSLNDKGQRKIALIDIEEMDSVNTGLFGGGLGRTGLVGLVNELQGTIVDAVAKENGVSTKDFKRAYEKRKNELEEGRKLQEFYKQHNIVTGMEPILVDLDTLGLDLKEKDTYVKRSRNEEGKIIKPNVDITLGEATKQVIDKINQLIQKKPSNKSVKGKRCILLNTNYGLIRNLKDLGLPKDKYFITEEEKKKLWLNRIIDALVDKGHLFKIEKENGHGYFIQA